MFIAAERERITELPIDGPVCQYLGPHGCTIYDNRPLICRMYGTIPTNHSCLQGCRPAEYLTFEQVKSIARDYIAIGGADAGLIFSMIIEIPKEAAG